MTAAMVIDAFLPEGVTTIAKDSIFMLPHLGVLSKLNPQAAIDVFEHDCIVNLCTCIAPVSTHRMSGGGAGSISFEIVVEGRTVKGSVKEGQLKLISLPLAKQVALKLIPGRKWNIGSGYGKNRSVQFVSGTLGVLFDCRGRPFEPQNSAKWDSLIIDKTLVDEVGT
jgi:hypothetical protein